MIDPVWIPLAGIALPVVLVPTVLGIRYARQEREFEHRERMKALEMGRTLPGDESWWSLPRIGMLIAVIVPVVSFIAAYQATTVWDDPRPAWVAATMVGVASVICGSGLAAYHFVRRDRMAEQVAELHAFKPPIDADAYDVVSRRG